jgi:hypothetical protein
MAIVYVWSGATGAANGTSWTDAYTTLGAAGSPSDGTDVYIADDHNESISANTTYGSSSLKNNPVRIWSVDRTDDSYSPAASVQLDFSGGAYDVTLNSSWEWHGVFIKIGDDLKVETSRSRWFYDCTFELTSALGVVSSGALLMRGGTLNFSDGVSGGYINASGNLHRLHGVTITGKARSTGLLRVKSAEYVGCDLTGLSGDSLYDPDASAGDGRVELHACKLPSSITMATSGWIGTEQTLELIGCDEDGASFGKRYRSEVHRYGGVMTVDTAIYRDAGWSDEDGDTSLSHKITPNSVCTKYATAHGIPLMAYVGSTGSKTFTVHLVEDFTTALTDQDAWMEVRYLGTADSTKWELVSSRPADLLAAGTTLATTTEAWTGASGKTKAKLTKTVTVNETGMYQIRVYLGKYESGKALWCCPQVEVS